MGVNVLGESEFTLSQVRAESPDGFSPYGLVIDEGVIPQAENESLHRESVLVCFHYMVEADEAEGGGGS